VETDLEFFDCPAFAGRNGTVRCGLPAEVEYYHTMRSTDGPLDSAKIRCPAGHVLNGPLESLTLLGGRQTAALHAAARNA
jgi:hypothetical protein